MKESVKSVCVTCQYSTVLHLPGNRTRIHCNSMQRDFDYPIESCSSHTEQGKSQYDFDKIAWVLEMKGTKIIGFVPPDPKKRNY